MKRCKECKNSISSKAKTCPYCGTPVKNNTGCLAVVIVLVLIFIAYPLIRGYNRAAEKAENKTINKQEYMLSCNEYNYEDIARNPDNYQNRNAKFIGKVIQVVENKDLLTLRVNVNANGEESSNTIYVEYTRQSGESRILENDVVTVYGTLNGIKTYENVLGSKTSIPCIKAKFIDINN